jgi:hypothetical protein
VAALLREEDIEQYLQDIQILNHHFTRFIAISCAYLEDNSDSNRSSAILRLRWRVVATTIEFFKRFYLYNSMLAYDPRIIMLGCIYLAGKVEHYYIRPKDILKIYDKCTEKELFDAEMLLLQGIGYELKINHPLNCNHTLLADYKRYCSSPEVLEGLQKNAMSDDALSKEEQAAAMQAWQKDSDDYLRVLQLSDASLIYNPVAVAVCSLLQTGKLLVLTSSSRTNSANSISLLQQSHSL